MVLYEISASATVSVPFTWLGNSSAGNVSGFPKSHPSRPRLSNATTDFAILETWRNFAIGPSSIWLMSTCWWAARHASPSAWLAIAAAWTTSEATSRWLLWTFFPVSTK